MSAVKKKRSVRASEARAEWNKRHQFEPFSQRVAKLKIDPLRNLTRSILDEDDSSDTASYFQTSLGQWKETNMSENFQRFAMAVSHFCGNLPQLLHYQDKIMDLLVEYMEKRDSFSLEPLLDLLSQFAHDLGARFERHFQRALVLVTSIAASHRDLEVVEWSFSCIAWLFKFLSRLLVPDLRPLFKIMAPLLGRERQKQFIYRFTAESLSFLVRRAASYYPKTSLSLEIFIKYCFEDLREHAECPNIESYRYGIANMLTEAIKGVKKGIYSNGSQVMTALMRCAQDKTYDEQMDVREISSRVLVATIHQTEPELFQPIFAVVIDYIREACASHNTENIDMGSRLLLILVQTMNGHCVQDWNVVVETLVSLLQAKVDCGQLVPEIFPSELAVTAAVLQLAPMNSISPCFQRLEVLIADALFSPYFLSFCYLSSGMGQERFQSLLLHQMQQFVRHNWQQNETELAFLLPRLAKSPILKDSAQEISLGKWLEHIRDEIDNFGKDQGDPVTIASYLDVLRCFSLESSAADALNETLWQQLFSVLDPACDLSMPWRLFVAGSAFKFLSEKPNRPLSEESYCLICKAATRYSTLPSFLESLLVLVKKPEFVVSDHSIIERLSDVLVENLSNPSHIIRVLSLEILEQLVKRDSGEVPSVLTTALHIEQTPINIQTARTISTRIRRLGTLYDDASSDRILSKIVPKYCFGLLNVKLAQAWDDAIEVLKVVSKGRVAEDVVVETAFSWLEGQMVPEQPLVADSEDEPRKWTSNTFEDIEVLRFYDKVRNSFENMNNVRKKSEERFVATHQLLTRTPDNSRALALKVLNSIPALAEKHSRELVPVFMSWAAPRTENLEQASDSSGSITVQGEPQALKWNLVDRKAMLGIFSQFVNPTVLYRASEVHNILLGLLMNGDVDVQKGALKALFTWKDPAINLYEEHLINVLDEAKFREELLIFLSSDPEDVTVQSEHRFTLLSVLVRLLYGRVVSRSGSGVRGHGQEAKRKAVLSALPLFDEAALTIFIDIALGPLNDLQMPIDPLQVDNWIVKDKLNIRRQSGLMNMIATILETLANHLDGFGHKILKAVLYCLIKALRRLQIFQISMETQESLVAVPELSLLKNIRQTGIKCLNLLFRDSSIQDWTPYLPLIFSELINPRLHSFPAENAQSVSGLLQIYGTWASNPKHIFFLKNYNAELLSKIAECAITPAAKPQVKLFVLRNVLLTILDFAKNSKPAADLSQRVRSEIVGPHVEIWLKHIKTILQSEPEKEVLATTIKVASILSSFVSSTSEVEYFIEISIELLNQPAGKVSPKTKNGVITLLQNIIPLSNIQQNEDLSLRLYSTISKLFSYFKDQESRGVLCLTLTNFAKQCPDLVEVANICTSLNAVSTVRLDEPDYDRRLKAFTIINEEIFQKLSPRQWLPILHNLFYYVQDNDELALRSNSSFGIRRFIEAAASSNPDNLQDYANVIKTALVPTLRNGMLESSELIRSEYAVILGQFVKYDTHWNEVDDLKPLLVDGDEEASFFNNILHIQQHRRQRALRRLAAEAKAGHIKSLNISRFFLPLIEHFIFERGEDESAHNLAAETVSSIECLTQWLNWQQFKATIKRYINQFNNKPELRKTTIKLLGSVLDALSVAASATRAPESNHGITDKAQGEERGDPMEEDEPKMLRSNLSLTMPSASKLAEECQRIITQLMDYVHLKDESEASLRVPLAVSTVKLVMLFPSAEIEQYLPQILSDLCNILRSRSQESRDLTRKCLADIAVIIGPGYIPFLLKELRTTLEKGYQLHVLGFTIHTILVSLSETSKHGDLDVCLKELVDIILDDIFGTVGQEKDAADYISKMREVRGNKSFDSVELLAKMTTIPHIIEILRPIQDLLREKLSAKLLGKIDELLRRIGIGLLRNSAIGSTDSLVFCYELICETKKPSVALSEVRHHREAWRERFEIDLKTSKDKRTHATTSSCSYKLVRFSLDVLRGILHKFDYLRIPENLSGLLPIIRDSLKDSQEEIKISAMRILATIIRVPLPEIDRDADIYVTEAVNVIRESPSMTSEISQASLKLIGSILRERKDVQVKEESIAYLLHRLRPDLDEPDRQGVIFNFIKAVLSQKIVITEVYEIMEQISTMMITDQNPTAQELTRSIYVQFLMEYPQSEARFTKQLAFLVKNLEYTYLQGRQSVMEVIHQLLLRIKDRRMSQIVIEFVFLPLALVIVNDQNTECRALAGTLIKEIFEKVDDELKRRLLDLAWAWLDRIDNPTLLRTSLQICYLFFEVAGKTGEEEWKYISPRVRGFIERREESDWQVIYHSLQLFRIASQFFPSFMFSPSQADLWATIRHRLGFPHAWVKASAAKLIGFQFSDIIKANQGQDLGVIPLKGTAGLELDGESMLQILATSIRTLKVPNISQALATQTVRNITFLGQCFSTNGLTWKSSRTNDLPEASDALGEDQEDLEDEVPRADDNTSALQHLFYQISAIIRREPPSLEATALTQKTASLQVIGVLCKLLNTSALRPCLYTIMLPLHNLTDTTIPSPHSHDDDFNTIYKSMVSTSQEILDCIQTRFGTTEFAERFTEVKKDVLLRRESRRVKRRIELVADPEKAGLEKRKKSERKKEKRKKRDAEHQSRRRGW